MTPDDDRYLEALALAHMRSPANTYEEDLLAEALNAARDRLGISEDGLDKYQRWAADRKRTAIV